MTNDILLSSLAPIISRVRTDVSATKGRNGKAYCTKGEPLTDNRLKEHLRGGTARGAYPMPEGSSTTKIALLDFDSHGGETSWEEMIKVAELVARELRKSDMKPTLFRSSGGRGIHLFLIWDDAQEAYSVREFLKDVLSRCGYENGTSGVANKEIEIFPKQNNIPVGGFGNMFILPYAGKSVPLSPLDLMPIEKFALVEWIASPSVPIATKPEPPQRTMNLTADLEKIKEMLTFIDPDIDYEAWLRICAALHYETQGSDEGLEVLDRWSKSGKKYKGFEEIKNKWRSFKPSIKKPSTIGTIRYYAKRGGYKDERRILDPRDHSGIARKILASEFTNGEEICCLWRSMGQWFSYRVSHYQEKTDEELRKSVRDFLDDSFKTNDKGVCLPFRPTMTEMNAVMDALRSAALFEKLAAPSWLNEDGRNPRDFISMENGLLHISTRTLYPHTAAFFTLNTLPFPFMPDLQPVEWLKFLGSVWPDDQESINTLQEIMGYLLVPDTSLQKQFLIIGPKRSGKGVIGRIIKELLGTNNVCAPTLTGLASQFGLQSLIGKLVAIISDARIGGRTDKAAIVERLLMITGEDNISIPRKYLEDWIGQLKARFLMLTNETPQLGDASGALASRFIVLTTAISFYGQEDTELEGRLLNELPQIMNWALDGLERLRKRRRFIQPATAQAAVRELEHLNSPLLEFIEDECEVGAGFTIKKDALFVAYQAWCLKQGRNFPSVLSTFARDLHSAFPQIGTRRLGGGADRQQVFTGVRTRKEDATIISDTSSVGKTVQSAITHISTRQGSQ